MQIARFRILHLSTTIFVVLGVLVWVFTHSDVIAWDPAEYAESAHGDPAYGVNRLGTPEDDELRYHTGSCAHCHDTFDPTFCENDPNGLMLFAPNNPTSQTDNFCFECHSASTEHQQVINEDYGATFGGGTANSSDIQAAFNFGPPNDQEPDGTTGSSHNLQMVRNWTKIKPAGDWITDDTNACLVCHDPHLSQKNHDPYPTPPTYKTAIRRPQAPSSGTNQPSNLWGDESGNLELLAEDPGVYQAPYYGSGPWDPQAGPFEPAGDATSDGSNLPNFVRFCAFQSCHSSTGITPAAHDAYGAQYPPFEQPPRNLKAIDWTTADHGLGHDSYITGRQTKAPYGDPNVNYILSCTDCHEPHGSESQWLLRTCVNGKEVGVTGVWQWYDFCTACHQFRADPSTSHQPGKNCNGCHTHGSDF